MKNVLNRLSGKNKSATTAKERLQLVLIHDRTDLPPGVMDKLRDELIEVISRHWSVDVVSIEVVVVSIEVVVVSTKVVVVLTGGVVVSVDVVSVNNNDGATFDTSILVTLWNSPDPTSAESTTKFSFYFFLCLYYK